MKKLLFLVALIPLLVGCAGKIETDQSKISFPSQSSAIELATNDGIKVSTEQPCIFLDSVNTSSYDSKGFTQPPYKITFYNTPQCHLASTTFYIVDGDKETKERLVK